MKKIRKIFILPFFLFLLLPMKVHAADASFYIGGITTATPDQSFSVQLINGTAGVNGLSGTYEFNGNNCVSLVSATGLNGSTLTGNKLMYSDYGNGALANQALAQINLKAISHSCTATITFNNLRGGFIDGTTFLKSAQATITVSAPLSTNNDLASLSVSQGSLSPSFSSGQTDYNVSVGANVESISIDAKVADNKAKLSGIGVKNLNYGSNKFAVVVTAENGSKKTYNVNVNREDNRASDANLKSLTVRNGKLSPSFSANTTSYTMNVSYDVSKLDLEVVAADSKSNVSISNPDLTPEGETKVTIKVTAENGTSKTYTILVTRGKDPNKVLNTDNSLVSLKPSIGMLSPSFDPNKLTYYMYFPYEVSRIDFEYEVSDKKYGKVEVKGDNELKANNKNVFTFSVTAEDESTKTYTVYVYRAKNPDSTDNDNVKIKELKLINGKIEGDFDPLITTYYYTKDDDFKLDIELDDEDATYKIVENNDDIYIVVEAQNGDIGVYCLHLKDSKTKKESKTSVVILSVVVGMLSIGIGYLLFDKFYLSKRIINRS